MRSASVCSECVTRAYSVLYLAPVCSECVTQAYSVLCLVPVSPECVLLAHIPAEQPRMELLLRKPLNILSF